MFSSPVSTVRHGVTPPAQLLSVPSTVRPSGSALVRTRASPAAGPVRVIGVVAVIRRLAAPITGVSRPDAGSRSTVTTDMPWAAMPMATCSGVGASGS